MGEIVYPPRFNTTDYGAVLNVMIKSTHKYKNNEGEIVERSQTLKAALWGKLAELNRNTQRHDIVALEGRSQNKKVQDQGGAEHWETEIVANAFEVLVGASPGEKKPAPDESAKPEFTDDDIPFVRNSTLYGDDLYPNKRARKPWEV